ncbi:NAD(P)/FAD-dependent oxidoreductase [Pseudoalteromonas sp. ZZD1]|uniref:NAD(P)/FAD-dependent oxidoreductase n=1 Tax=Pseudoalteromonas sp. ZZD1 TaxID=3139395 RepID=UPI003BA8AD64
MPLHEHPQRQADVVIIGAGVAGCIAALALCDTYHVILIDKVTAPEERIGECLAPAARRILQQLGLLAEFESQLTSSSSAANHLHNVGMKISWGQEATHIADNLNNPDGSGWRLDRQAFEVFLRAQAQRRGVTCIWPAKLNNSHYNNRMWQISLATADTQPNINIAAQFVIDASGRQAHFAKKYTTRIQTDRLISCWATMPDIAQNKLGSICATNNGWWYSAPLPRQRRVIAFQTDSDLITKGLHRNVQLFIKHAQCQQQLASLLVDNESALNLQGIVSANSTRLKIFSGQQWAALGDAAISFDPLSSQGIFNAMASSMQLAKLINESQIIKFIGNDTQQFFNKTYQRQIELIWQQYLYHQHYFYSQEQRWSNHVFWRRRQLQNELLYS